MVIAGEVLSDEEGDGGGQQDGDDWLRGLEARAREHLAQRLAPTSRRKLATVMRHLRRLQRRLLGKRRLFKVPRRSGDMAALLHNEWSLVIFAEFLALRKGRAGRGASRSTRSPSMSAWRSRSCQSSSDSHWRAFLTGCRR